MRVCFFCEKWESGGIEAFVTGALERMDRSGLTVELVTAQARPGVYDRRLEAMGVERTVLSGSTRNVPANLRLFRALLKARAYDAVHLHLYEGLALLFAREAGRAGVPLVIVHSHNTDLRPGALRPAKLRLHRLCVRRLADCADRRWAPSGAAGRFLFGDRPFEIVKNGIDPARFAFDPAAREKTRKALNVAPEELLIGCVGRLCAQKNQEFLLGLLPVLPKSRLLLVGEGENEAMLRALAAKQGLTDRVIFFGTSEDMPALYAAMDAFCLPSRFEALGIAAIEAQAAGLYTLCSPAVPPEAGATALFAAAPLCARSWAGLLQLYGRDERRNMTAELRAAGYDMADTAAKLRAAYEEVAP